MRWPMPPSRPPRSRERSYSTRGTLPAGVTTIAVKYADVYAITANGSVWAWGSNNHGELGNGTIDPQGGSLVPVRVTGF